GQSGNERPYHSHCIPPVRFARLLRDLDSNERTPERLNRVDSIGQAAAHLLFISIRTTSNGLSVRFSGRCLPATFHTDCPAFTSRSSDLPSGSVNLIRPSVMNTAIELGCSCMTDFSCGP